MASGGCAKSPLDSSLTLVFLKYFSLHPLCYGIFRGSDVKAQWDQLSALSMRLPNPSGSLIFASYFTNERRYDVFTSWPRQVFPHCELTKPRHRAPMFYTGLLQDVPGPRRHAEASAHTRTACARLRRVRQGVRWELQVETAHVGPHRGETVPSKWSNCWIATTAGDYCCEVKTKSCSELWRPWYLKFDEVVSAVEFCLFFSKSLSEN